MSGPLPTALAMRQLPLPLSPAGEADFDGFVPGPNQAALAHLQNLSLPSPPVYLWGPSGSGKTHLLRALVHQVRERGGRAAVFEHAAGAPMAVAEDWTLAALDDCDLLSAAQQADAFRLFVDAATLGVQIVAAGRLPPVDLPLREDLRTRLAWGPVFALVPLPEDAARAALRRDADRRGIFLGDDVMNFLLTRFSRDLKHLMALLDQLDRYAMAHSRHVTVPLLRSMLDEDDSA